MYPICSKLLSYLRNFCPMFPGTQPSPPQYSETVDFSNKCSVFILTYCYCFPSGPQPQCLAKSKHLQVPIICKA